MIDKNSAAPEKMDIVNDRAKLYFLPTWHFTESQFYANFGYLKESFSIFYNREHQTVNVIKGKLINNLDGSIGPFSFFYQFSNKKSGTTLSEKELFEILEEKKLELGPDNFDDYVNGKRKNFVLEAFAAKDSENPVPIVYTVKKYVFISIFPSHIFFGCIRLLHICNLIQMPVCMGRTLLINVRTNKNHSSGWHCEGV